MTEIDTDTEVSKLRQLELLPPEQLMGGRKQVYNEVVVEGTSKSGKKVSIAGVFIKTNSRGRPYIDSESQERLETLAKKLNVPIVRITKRGEIPDEPLYYDASEGEGMAVFSMTKNAIHYYLQVPLRGSKQANKTAEFRIIDEDARSVEDDESRAFFVREITSQARTNESLRHVLNNLPPNWNLK